MKLLGDEAQAEARFGPFRDSANLMEDRRMVCAECTIGSEFVWMHPMELLGDVGHGESCFDLFRDGVCVGAR
jgi:hypothetical protein